MAADNFQPSDFGRIGMTDPTVIAAVVTSTKTGEHWVTLADYYRDYSGIARLGDTAAPPEAAEGCPPPNSYSEYPIVGLWVILPVIADDIQAAGHFKRFDSKYDAYDWLRQNSANWIGNE
jgi:hypothetical protein